MALGVNYLRIVGLSQMFMMVEQTSIGAFSGLGRTLYPSIVSVTFTSARIPVAVLLSSVMGLSGIVVGVKYFQHGKGMYSVR
mgnify:CR=1 FL=1